MKERKEQLKRELRDIVGKIKELNKDVDETSEDVDDIKEEIEDTGKDVDEIKEDVEEILEEVEDTGKDVDEIKEDIKSIQENIGKLQKGGILSRVRERAEKFEFDDFAQQIVGAIVLSAPFVVTEEVWRLAQNLSLWQVIAIVLITITFDYLLFYHAKFQRVQKETVINFIPLRILSLLFVTYLVSAVVLTIFGVIGNQVLTAAWSLKLIILVGLFANIGAGAADLLR